jgi:LemA protein
MKKWLIPVIIIVVVGFGLYQWAVGFNNTAVEYEANAKTAWSNVESSYQRRNDLIGNLVKTVQGAADFERNTLTDVIEARAKATATTIDANNLTSENMAQFQQAQTGLSGALSRLLVSVERYPELKANQNFLELQSQLEGTENRINIARDRFNERVNIYDIHTSKFPGKLLAGLFGFEEMPRYQADPGSENAPDVNFDFQIIEPMPNIEDFLTSKEEEEIVEAIRIAESQTSGEIRVHIEADCKIDAFERALEVFHMLKMDNTKARNGVLIYVAVTNRSFVIFGDEGINDVVSNEFWNSTRDKIASQFKKGHFKQGLVDGVTEAGQALSKHFPWHHNVKDELDNTISKG